MSTLAVDPHGALAFVPVGRSVHQLDVENPSAPPQVLQGRQRRWAVDTVTCSPHSSSRGATLALASGPDVVVWRVEADAGPAPLETEMQVHTRRVTGLSWDPFWVSWERSSRGRWFIHV